MTLPTVGNINYPTVEEIRDGMLRTIKLGLARVGITVNVLPGSDHYIRCEALARRLVVAFANNQIALEDFNPLVAKGEALVQLAGVFGVKPRPASKANGPVTIVCSGTVTIPSGYRALAPNGALFETIAVNTKSNGGSVELRAVLAGTSGNQKAGTKLVWTSAAVGAMGNIATVAVGGIDGGADTDTEEVLRARLLDRLANPSVGGNAASVKATAEDASAAVEAAYVYAAVRGPSSLDVAVTKAAGDRTLSGASVSIVASALAGALPGHADINVTSVEEQGVDVVLRATLPDAAVAGGAGGGWRDGAPWPQGAPAAGSDDGKVTAYAAGVATVRTVDAPSVGNAIGIWDAVGQVMHQYTITTVGGVSGAWTIKVQGLEGAAGFKTSPLNAYVSAGAENLVTYAKNMLTQVEALGPGEKTASLELLPRSRRYPTASTRHPRDLDNRILGALQKASPELEAVYGLRLETGTTTAITGPAVPSTTTDPPRILTLKQFAIWKA